MQPGMRRGAVAEINLDAVAHNFNVAAELAGSAAVIPVVKADAYGHGAVRVSERLVKEGASCLAVAYMSEAVELRKAGIKSSILILFEKYDLSDFFKYNLIPVIHDLGTALKISAEAKKRGHPLDVHFKIDTGLGRLGLNGSKIAEEVIEASKMDHINIAGLMSHFSDSDISDKSYALMQLRNFNAVREKVLAATGWPARNLLCHISNSAAIISFKDALLDAVRPGLMLYGCLPFNHSSEPGPACPGLIPAMTVKTGILALKRFPKGSPISYGRTFTTKRDSLIAVLPVGYADGFSRAFSNNGDALVHGKRVPVVGRVCMDLTMLDVTEISGVKEGDDVVLLGSQGDEEITAWEMALKTGTIPYEIFTSLGGRSKKEYEKN